MSIYQNIFLFTACSFLNRKPLLISRQNSVLTEYFANTLKSWRKCSSMHPDNSASFHPPSTNVDSLPSEHKSICLSVRPFLTPLLAFNHSEWNIKSWFKQDMFSFCTFSSWIIYYRKTNSAFIGKKGKGKEAKNGSYLICLAYFLSRSRGWKERIVGKEEKELMNNKMSAIRGWS